VLNVREVYQSDAIMAVHAAETT